MVDEVDESSESPLINLNEDIEDCEEQVGDNQVVIQATREGPTSKGCSSTAPHQDQSNEEMQYTLGVHEEGQLVEEQRYPTKQH